MQYTIKRLYYTIIKLQPNNFLYMYDFKIKDFPFFHFLKTRRNKKDTTWRLQ